MSRLAMIVSVVALFVAGAQAGTTQLEFEVVDPTTIGPPYPSVPPIEVRGGAGMPVVDSEMLRLQLLAPDPAMGLRMQARDGGGGYQVESFFDVFIDVPPIEPESFFDIFTRVELRTPGGGAPLPLRADVRVEPRFIDSFFDVFFEIDLGGGAFNSNQLRIETNPLQPVEFKSAVINNGGHRFDSFFDVFFELEISGPLAPGQPLYNVRLTGESYVPEPPAAGLLLLGVGTLALRRRRT